MAYTVTAEYALYLFSQSLFRTTQNARLSYSIASDIGWWLSTGRASGTQEIAFRRLTKHQYTTLAKRIVKGAASETTEDRIKIAREYIDSIIAA